MFGPSKKELLARIEALERTIRPISEPQHAWGYRVSAEDLVNDFCRRNKPVPSTERTWVPNAPK